MAKRLAAAALLALALAASSAVAAPPAPEEVWPAPDPRSWWDEARPKPPEAADPLGNRRLNGSERPVAVDNGVDAVTYRLWGLPPLQTQVVRGGEMILEIWIRPSGGVRQSIVRIVLRRDGKAFVQARAGLVCCEPGIARRVGFDAEIDGGPFRTLRDHPMWDAPRNVRVAEAGGLAETLCIDGTAYDLTLAVAGRARSLRRACDAAAIGQVADALEPALHAALGHEPRLDVLFPDAGDFTAARRAYETLIKEGGSLKAEPPFPLPPAGEAR